MTLPVRLGVAGAGAIGRRHIELIRAHGQCTLAGIADPSPAAAELAVQLGVAHHRDVPSLIAAQWPDGVIIATPNARHLDDALACIEAGIAALVEKPLAASVAEGERLCRAVEDHGARLLVGHHRAHSPLLAAAREVVQQGRLGALVAVSGTALFYKPAHYFDEAPWRRQTGGGPVLINLIHEIGNLRSLCGEIRAVQAITSNARRGFEVEDTAALLLHFENGALGSFLLSDTAASARSWEQTSQENPDYASYDDEDCYLLVGTEGSLAIPTMRLKTCTSRQERSWFVPMQRNVVDAERADPLQRQLDHFCDVVRGHAEPLVSARDGLQNLRVIDAVVQAARSGAVVAVEAGATP